MCKEQYREYVPVQFNDWEKKVTSQTKTIEIKMFNHSVKNECKLVVLISLLDIYYYRLSASTFYLAYVVCKK